MRPRLRFSLRWLLIAFTVLVPIVYLLFVRPTVIVHQLVDAINKKDYRFLQSMDSEPIPLKDTVATFKDLDDVEHMNINRVSLNAVAVPSSWGDIFRFRRRANVLVNFRNTEIQSHSDTHSSSYHRSSSKSQEVVVVTIGLSGVPDAKRMVQLSVGGRVRKPKH